MSHPKCTKQVGPIRPGVRARSEAWGAAGLARRRSGNERPLSCRQRVIVYASRRPAEGGRLADTPPANCLRLHSPGALRHRRRPTRGAAVRLACGLTSERPGWARRLATPRQDRTHGAVRGRPFFFCSGLTFSALTGLGETGLSWRGEPCFMLGQPGGESGDFRSSRPRGPRSLPRAVPGAKQ